MLETITIKDYRAKEEEKQRQRDTEEAFWAVLPHAVGRKGAARGMTFVAEEACQLAMEVAKQAMAYVEATREGL